MVPHLARLIIIAVCFIASLISLVVLVALGKTSGEGFVAVCTLLSVFTPALLDAVAVKHRRAAARKRVEAGNVEREPDADDAH